MESPKPRSFQWLSPLIFLSSHWISRIGVILVTAASVSWILQLPTLVRGRESNPYLGILGFLILPAIFILGLILIPIGIFLKRSTLKKHHEVAPSAPLTFANPEVRHLLNFVLVTTAANIILAAYGGYGAVHYMETPAFCGQACHSVMAPEFHALPAGAHSQVACVKCHIGDGPEGFARAKLNGVNQVMMLAFNTYPRPIHLTLSKRLPATETCRGCHSLGAHQPQILRVISKYADDEASTPATTVLMMQTGAIHAAHTGVRFLSDETLENIGRIEVDREGKTIVYESADVKMGPEPTLRNMDCLECHNRPAHSFQSAERAVDGAIGRGVVSRTLPFARKNAVAVLQSAKTSAELPAAFAAFYKDPQQQTDVRRAGAELVALFNRNVYPALNVTWGTYPLRLGHNDSPGCFRCHDGGHKVKGSDKVLGQDCTMCHNMLAMDEAAPTILKDLGISK